MKAPMPNNLIAGVLFTLFALPLAIPFLFVANQRRDTVRPMKNTHIRQVGSNNDTGSNNADLGAITPTIEQKLEAALTEITRLQKENTKLTNSIGDFIPEGQVMIGLENYQLMQEVVREHNALMPLFVINEAMDRKLMDKDNLKEYTAEQVARIDEAMITPDETLWEHMDAWIRRNPEFGFKFELVKPKELKKTG